jgi:hypothetical protein
MKDFTVIISTCKFGNLSISDANKLINEQLDNAQPSEWKLGEGFVKKVLSRYTKEEISFGKMVELFNEHIQSSAGEFSSDDMDYAIELLKGWDSGEAIQGLPEKTELFLESLTHKPQNKNDAVEFVKWIKNSDWQFSREKENCLDKRAGNLIHGIILESEKIETVYKLFKKEQFKK